MHLGIETAALWAIAGLIMLVWGIVEAMQVPPEVRRLQRLNDAVQRELERTANETIKHVKQIRRNHR